MCIYICRNVRRAPAHKLSTATGCLCYRAISISSSQSSYVYIYIYMYIYVHMYICRNVRRAPSSQAKMSTFHIPAQPTTFPVLLNLRAFHPHTSLETWTCEPGTYLGCNSRKCNLPDSSCIWSNHRKGLNLALRSSPQASGAPALPELAKQPPPRGRARS